MLSAVVVAWNAEKYLDACLSSLKKFCDELVVVIDAATTDSTPQIVKKYTTRHFRHPHMGIVEPMRNFALSKAKGDWILLLDADESLPDTLGEKLREVISQTSADFVRLPRQNLIFGQWIKSQHWWPDYVYRLFRKGAVTWSSDIHAIPKTTGTGIDLEPKPEYALIHQNYQTVSQFIDRLNRYTDFQTDLLRSKDIRFTWTDLITKPSAEFLTQFFARSGYQDGLHGLALALLQACSELVVYLKLWQQEGFAPQPLPLSALRELLLRQVKDFNWWYQETSIKSSQGLRRLSHRLRRKLPL